MARPKHKMCSEICADCGALEPKWAAVNRGILLCNECCSIHRSLGRHVSQIKPLFKTMWNMNLHNMVHTLNENGANSIWEHSLLDPCNLKNGRRKPQFKDPLHPVKAEFIKAKHQQLAFIIRPTKEEFCTEEELSKQLHSSVRTSNLETSLRLLAQGANTNYFHKEKGTTPLHVAARAGQVLQVELLIVNGANPTIVDSNGQIAADIARTSGYLDLADRLTECMYEVTDRLTYYVYSRKPDHKTDEHLIVPEWSNLSCQTLNGNGLISEGQNKLQRLSNHLLEELAADIYDEVDRRETEALWFTISTHLERCMVPFLPVNPHLSSTRNQGRQKLARFSEDEFNALIVNLLAEAGRRHMLAQNSCSQGQEQLTKYVSQVSDDEPLYDSVASDDEGTVASPEDVFELSLDLKVDNKDTATPSEKGLLSVVEVLKKQLAISESTIRDFQMQVNQLQDTIHQLKEENSKLKQPIRTNNQLYDVTNGHVEDHESEFEPINDIKSSFPRPNQRPVSMYEPREGIRKPVSWTTTICQSKRDAEILARNNTQSLWECGALSLPTNEEVHRHTEQITKRIQELWMAMQSPNQREAFVPCAEKIRAAVTELTAIFPRNPIEENIRSALRQLNGNTGRLQAECSGLQRCSNDIEHMNRCLQQVRSCAYDIAKATKLILTQFQT